MGHYKSNHKTSSKRQHSNNIKLNSSVKSWIAFSANSGRLYNQPLSTYYQNI